MTATPALSLSTGGTAGSPGKQALKSLRTRALLVLSAVALIRKEGLAATSAKRIAQDAGVTWGAAQHHFGSKERVLEAVVAESHTAFQARFADMDTALPFARRVEQFIDRMWAHYSSDLYLATVEIVMADRGADAIALPAFDWPNHDHMALMQRIFHDRATPPESMLDALLFIHCQLTGLSIQGLLRGQTGPTAQHIGRCRQILEAMLR